MLQELDKDFVIGFATRDGPLLLVANGGAKESKVRPARQGP
jgi:hypothetical protein